VAVDLRIFWKNERIAFLALSTLKGVGFWTLHQIATSNISFAETFKKSLEKYLRLEEGATPEIPEIRKKLWRRGINLISELEKIGTLLVFKGEDRFPQKLANIEDAPKWIFIQGSIANLSSPTVGIVGTRKPSEDGLFLTRLLVLALAKNRISTVSGLALGIDQLAHLESIKYGLPTIAVLGTGISESYPRGSEPIRDLILKNGGTIITEYLPTQTYSSENFVRRNRLQAALADTLVPVEWKIKSGTAHTVAYAWKYHKKIVNIYLPRTYSVRPEIEFSSKTYGAYYFEVPSEIPELLTRVWTDSEEQRVINLEPSGQLGLEL